jgi:transposase
LQNQIEALLEEMRIKLSSVITDLVGVSGFRILRAIADGETDAAKLASLGDARLKCREEELMDSLNVPISKLHREILKLMVDRMELIRKQMEELDKLLSAALKGKESAVKRLAAVPGLGPQSALQIIAEVGPDAKNFASAAEFASWIGTCPGTQESAECNQSGASPKGNRFMRRILMQAAMAAVKTKGSIFQAKFRQLLPSKGYKQAAWAIAHKLSRVLWKLLHDGVDYIELGPSRNEKAAERRINRMCGELRRLGFTIQKAAIATA